MYVCIYVCLQTGMTLYDNRLEFLVGDRDALSFYDLKNMNIIYKCKGKFPTGHYTLSIIGHIYFDKAVFAFNLRLKLNSSIMPLP